MGRGWWSGVVCGGMDAMRACPRKRASDLPIISPGPVKVPSGRGGIAKAGSGKRHAVTHEPTMQMEMEMSSLVTLFVSSLRYRIGAAAEAGQTSPARRPARTRTHRHAGARF